MADFYDQQAGLLKVVREGGKRFKVDIRLGALQFPTRRIRTPHTDGQDLSALAHFNIFRSVADVAGFLSRATKNLHCNVQAFRVRLPIAYVFMTNDHFKKICEP